MDMDWDNLKHKSDQRKDNEKTIMELKKRWEELDIECTRYYLQFDVETTDAKDSLEAKAIKRFENYFLNKGFNVTGNASKLEATYNDIKITFTSNEGYAYSIHFYIGRDLRDCKVFSLQMAKEFEGQYKQLLVDKIKDNSSIEFAQEQIDKLERNKKEILRLIADKDKISFKFELDKHYSGIDGQYDSIEEIIETLEDKFVL
ncbi:hypothetical protein ACFSO0_11790 [Brevibacillus sp. GCM10020057]|uniref:hypothetical protein n=1 Tax=Brevibacillus sp. GCM10020057 TaxID=3317327 RepID=UPI003640A6D6